jgi:DNA-binding response OmpR family regulator
VGSVRTEGLVLLAEPDPVTAELARSALADDFGIHVETDGTAAIAAARRLRPSVIVLGVGLSEVDGPEVYRRLRDAGDETPILFVTADDEEIDQVSDLAPGPYDYVTTPFRPRELLARLRAVVRWSPPLPEEAHVHALVVGDVCLDPARRRVWAGPAEVALTTTEFDLLSHLMRRPGQVFERHELLTDVWGYRHAAGTRTVDVHIAQLRAKLGEHSPLRTVRGVGYAAEAD